LAREAQEKKEPLSIALLGNAAETHPEFVKRGVIPDIVTDQTSAHDPLGGYIPMGLSLAEAKALRKRDPKQYIERAMKSMAVQVEAMLEMKRKGRRGL
jgi:urocanate hydratase